MVIKWENWPGMEIKTSRNMQNTNMGIRIRNIEFRIQIQEISHFVSLNVSPQIIVF